MICSLKDYTSWPSKLPDELLSNREWWTQMRLDDFYVEKAGHRRYLENSAYYNSEGVWSKRCSQCQKEFPREKKYWRKNGSKDGMTSDCLSCRRKKNREVAKERYRQNPEKIKQQIKRWATKYASKQIEANVQKDLKMEIGGETEVPTVYGRIDLLTSDTIYEIKDWRYWKQALGQVLTYAIEYPRHRMVLCLYGRKEPKNWQLITEACFRYNVEAEFHIKN